jgi:hypothetical protein
VGLSSTLPPALRRLEHQDRIERVPEGLRLDSERWVWRLSSGKEVAGDAASWLARLGEVFLRAAGAGTVKEFAAWAGVPQRDARAAVESLPSVEVDVEGGEALMLASDLRSLLDRRAAAEQAVVLLGVEDNLGHLHGGPARFVDPRHHGLALERWGWNRAPTLGSAKHLGQRMVLAEGKLVGFWDYDPDARAIVTALFDEVSAASREKLELAARRLGRFLAGEIGHGRTTVLDTDDALRERVARLRARDGKKKATPARSRPDRPADAPPRFPTVTARGRSRSPRAASAARPRSGR